MSPRLYFDADVAPDLGVKPFDVETCNRWRRAKSPDFKSIPSEHICETLKKKGGAKKIKTGVPTVPS